MAYEASPADIEKFCKKLEQFAAGLSDLERTLLQSITDRGQLSDTALGQVQGGVMSFSQAAPRLNASYFLRNVFGHSLTDW